MDKYWSLLTEALTQEFNSSVKRFPDAGTLDAAATTVAPILPCGGGVPFHSPSNIQHHPSRDRSEQFGCAGLVQLHDSGVS